MGLRDRFQGLKYFLGFNYDSGSGYFNSIPANPSGGGDDGLSYSTIRILQNAERNPIVYSVVDWLADQIRTAPIVLKRTKGTGDAEIIPDHPLLDLLTKPSEFFSGRELLSVSSWDMLLRGQCFWHKDRINNGQVESLTFLPASLTEVKGTRETLITEYVYKPRNGPNEIYEPSDIIHIRLTPNPNDPKNGMPPLIALARALLVENQSGDYTSIFLTEAGAAGGFLMPPRGEVIPPELAEATKKYIQTEFKGSKRGTLGVLRAAFEFIRTTIDPKTAGTHEIHDEVIELICSVFGVHPVIVGLGAGSAQSRVGAATKELERAAWTNRVIPVQDTISEQIGRQLLPEFIDEAQLKEWKVDWDRSKVYSLQPDLLKEAQRWSVGMNAGWAMRYDARKAQGLETGDEDKFYLVRTGIQFVAPGELPDSPIQQPPQGDAPPENGTEDDEDGNGNGNGNGSSQRSRRMKQAALTGWLKVALNNEQRRLLLVLADDFTQLETEFSGELEDAFSDLANRAVTAFWEVEGGQALLYGGGNVLLKQTPQEITNEVNRIMQSLSVSTWEQGILIPAWDGHTLRTLNTTVGSVNSSLGLAVNIPDPVSRGILQRGGSRRGLVDFTGQTRSSLFNALTEGRTLGEGPAQLARRIRSHVDAGPFINAGPEYRAQLIARTETAYAQNDSSDQIYREAGVFTGVQITDGDYDDVCENLNGVRLTFEEFDALGEEKYIAHPQCTRSIAPVRVTEDAT